MPGATSLGIPYPYQGETVDADSWENLANAVDGLMTSLDAIRTLAADRPTAALSGGSANAVASATTTTVTAYSNVTWDNAGYADLGAFPNQLTVPPGVYYVAAGGFMSAVTTIAMARVTILAGGITWGGGMVDTLSGSISTTLSSVAAVVVLTGATNAVQSQVRWQGTGGPPNFTLMRLQVMQIRALADV